MNTQITKRKDRIPVEKMKNFRDVLQSSVTERMMLSTNENFDTKYALASLYLASQEPKSKISEASPESIVGCLMRCAHADLYPIAPGGGTSKVGMWVVPFWSKQKKCYVATLIPSYQAMVFKAIESGMAQSITCGVVYDDDDLFVYVQGLEPKLEHRPGPREGDIEGAWGLAVTSGGQKIMDYLTWGEIEKRAKAGGGKGDNPFWNEWPAEMARKTILRSLSGQLPPAPRASSVMQHDHMMIDDSELHSSKDFAHVDVIEDANHDAPDEEIIQEEVTQPEPKPKTTKAKPKAKPEPEPEAEAEIEEPADEPEDEADDTGAEDEVDALIARVRNFRSRGVDAEKIKSLLHEHLANLEEKDADGFKKVMNQIDLTD